jgi:hypothetical protein
VFGSLSIALARRRSSRTHLRTCEASELVKHESQTLSQTQPTSKVIIHHTSNTTLDPSRIYLKASQTLGEQ